MNRFLKTRLQQQLILAGVLGVGTLFLSSHIFARGSIDTATESQVRLNDGEIIDENTTYYDVPTKIYYDKPSSPISVIGIYNQKDTTADIKLGNGSVINTGSSGSDGTGIYIGGDQTLLTTAGAVKINVGVPANGNAYGLRVSAGGANINLGSGSEIVAESSTAWSPTFRAYGILLESTTYSEINGNAIKITSKGGYNSAAVQISGRGLVDLGSGSTILGNIVSGAEGGLFKANHINIDGVVSAAGGGKVEIGAGSQVNRIYTSSGTDDKGGVVDFKGTASERNLIHANSALSQPAQVIANHSYSVINLDYVDVEANGSNHLEAAYNGIINASNIRLSYTAPARNNLDVAIQAWQSGVINLTGENTLHRLNPDEALLLGYGGQVIVNGKMDMIGSVFSDLEATGLVDLTLTQGSVWTGMAGGKLYTGQDGTVKVNLTGSTWNMTADSKVNDLVLNNSTIDFVENKVGSVLSVGNLSGTGTFVMHVDLVSDSGTNSGDKLVVTEKSTGHHYIKIVNQGRLSTTGNEVLTVVETPDGGADFSLLSTSRKIELGGYIYGVRKASNGKDWELYSYFRAADKLDEAAISSTANASANFLNVGYLLNYAETQTLLQRMGDLRQSDGGGDAWVRAFTGKFDSFSVGKLSSFDMDYSGVQFGVDRRLNIDAGNVYLGVMSGASRGNPDYNYGDGTVKGYHFGIYGTFVAASDFYVDALLKYSHIKNEFSQVPDTQGNLVNGDASSDGYGMSIEVGKRFYWNEARSGFYIEPQAQLSYTHQGSATTRASNGLITEIDSYDSTLGRLSALIGYEIKEGANPINVYFKTGYVEEMSGKASYSLNGSKEGQDFGGSWWENGLGVTAQFSNKHSLYLDGTYSVGNRFNQTQVNAGYRYSF